MSFNVTVDQATDFMLRSDATIDGAVLTAVSAAKYCIYSARKVLLLEKTLGNGISFVDEKLLISFVESDTFDLEGSYMHECLARDPTGRDVLVFRGTIRINKVLTRF